VDRVVSLFFQGVKDFQQNSPGLVGLFAALLETYGVLGMLIHLCHPHIQAYRIYSPFFLLNPAIILFPPKGIVFIRPAVG
jgi:hypothetical protein